MRTAALIHSLASFMLLGCTPQGDPGMGAVLTDDFERQHLGATYRKTGGDWRIDGGKLRVKGARNHPLWLRRVLPRDVRIEFDVQSATKDGDIKIEVFGDGSSFAKTDAYVATGYVVIFGGWDNTKNVIARLDEHGTDRVEGAPRPVVQNKPYRMRIERVGERLTVWANEAVLVEMDDPEPLLGRGHDHFGFNNWQSDLTFDNLKITAL